VSFYQNIADDNNDWKVLFPGEEDVYFFFIYKLLFSQAKIFLN